jgi:ferredoxin
MEERDAGTGPENVAGGLVKAGWRVGVDAQRCIGSGLCAGTAPEHFRLEGSVSTPVRALVDPNDAVLDAAASGPVEAITVHDAASGQLIAPEP